MKAHIITHGGGPGYVYFMAHQGLTKIGYSTCPPARWGTFAAQYPDIAIAHVIATNAMRPLELLIHSWLRDYHVSDAVHDGEEWFRLPGDGLGVHPLGETLPTQAHGGSVSPSTRAWSDLALASRSGTMGQSAHLGSHARTTKRDQLMSKIDTVPGYRKRPAQEGC
jgi:hypothetical protein